MAIVVLWECAESKLFHSYMRNLSMQLLLNEGIKKFAQLKRFAFVTQTE